MEKRNILIQKIEYVFSKLFKSKKQFNTKSIFRTVLLILVVDLVWSICFPYFYPKTEGASSNVTKLAFNFWTITAIVVIGPMIEEWLFRSPLYFIYKGTKSYIITFLSVLGLSFLFGYLHGNLWNVSLQGFSGFIYSIVFLRISISNDDPALAWFTTTICHGCFNGIIVLICFLLR